MANNQFYDPSNFFSASSGQQYDQSQYQHKSQQQNGPFYADWQQNTQHQTFYNPQMNGDQLQFQTTDFQDGAATDFIDDEVPLLEELGINFEHIFSKTKCVLNPMAMPQDSIIHDEDLAGPLVFCIAYGFSNLLAGKIQFGYIYGITVLGCLCMYMLLSLMQEKSVSACCITSTLGYCLLPMVFLSFLSSVISLNGIIGLLVSGVFILWCSFSASKLFVHALSMSNQQALVLYPCFLLYGMFALLNVF
jgi:protein YIPF5/7